MHSPSQVRQHGTSCRAPFTTLRPWKVSRRRWRHFSSLLTFNFPLLILMLLNALYERLCTTPLNRLPCYGALEVIVTLLLLLFWNYWLEIWRVKVKTAVILKGSSLKTHGGLSLTWSNLWRNRAVNQKSSCYGNSCNICLQIFFDSVGSALEGHPSCRNSRSNNPKHFVRSRETRRWPGLIHGVHG